MGCACTKQGGGTPELQRGRRKSKKPVSVSTSSLLAPLPLPVSRQGSVRHSDLSGKLDSNGDAIGNVEKERERERERRRRRQQQQQSLDPVISRSRREQQQQQHPHLLPYLHSGQILKQREGEQVAAGWPAWLSAVAGEAIKGWIPRRADSFEKLAKIGQGTYSNVYKARDIDSGKIVALKKVRFDNLEPESVRFMAREILILRRLDHPNVIKLEGLVTSRMSCSLYLVFEYMEHDLAGLAACPDITFTEPQVKCYMHQLLSGMEHCHNRGVLHRDIKGSNLLLDNGGILKIADFGLATFYHPNQKQPMTSRVVTLWYRPPELLLGATEYGVGVDLWSTGCILAELLAGKPIMPGRTEVEQLHKIFKLCGSPSEEYWKKSKLPHATIFKPQQPYKRCIAETFRAFPASALALLEKLLAIEPSERGSASSALKSEFFTTKPYACIPSSLPKYPPSKEMDAKVREEEARRQRAGGGKAQCDAAPKRGAPKDRTSKAVPAPEANAELPVNLQKRRLVPHSGVISKSEKFPPPHEDSAVGFPIEPQRQGQLSGGGGDNRGHLVLPPHHMLPPTSVSGPIVHLEGGLSSRSGPMGNPPSMVGGLRRKKANGDDIRMAPPRPHSNRSGDPVSLTSSRSHAASSNNDLFREPPKNTDIEIRRSERLKSGEALLDPPKEILYRRNRRSAMKPLPPGAH